MRADYLLNVQANKTLSTPNKTPLVRFDVYLSKINEMI